MSGLEENSDKGGRVLSGLEEDSDKGGGGACQAWRTLTKEGGSCPAWKRTLMRSWRRGAVTLTKEGEGLVRLGGL